MRTPLISILLPMWNAVTTLPACLRSIQRQTEANWECLIIDDGSDDDSVACAQQFAHRDPRFRVLVEPHRGLVATLNAGIGQCRGRYIARMDADDLMHKARLTAQGQLLQWHADMSAVGCHVRLFPRTHLRDGRRAYEQWLNSLDTPERVVADAFVECPIAHPTLMIRRRVLTDFGYRDCGWPEDYDLILRLLENGYRVGVVPRRLLSWRDQPQRLSRSSPTYAQERFTACKAAFLAATFLATTDTYILWGYGTTGKALRRALVAYKKTPSYIVELHPGRLGKAIHGAPVIPPGELMRIPRQPLVVSVAGTQARSEIRAALQAMHFTEIRDFVCAA